MANKHKVGLVFAALLGGWHFVWSLLVLSGWAQSIYDFILWAHMIHVPLVIGPFDITAAVTLVILTAVLGYIGGYIGAWVWNKFHR
ncbi:MAG TPA: hypothetical protein VG984_01175 [Candidatus Paceibacterota bacterium]|nr:hypothetical protein [Candidatus Paceibacterota bacterium]